MIITRALNKKLNNWTPSKFLLQFNNEISNAVSSVDANICMFYYMYNMECKIQGDGDDWCLGFNSIMIFPFNWQLNNNRKLGCWKKPLQNTLFWNDFSVFNRCDDTHLSIKKTHTRGTTVVDVNSNESRKKRKTQIHRRRKANEIKSSLTLCAIRIHAILHILRIPNAQSKRVNNNNLPFETSGCFAFFFVCFVVLISSFVSSFDELTSKQTKRRTTTKYICELQIERGFRL